MQHHPFRFFPFITHILFELGVCAPRHTSSRSVSHKSCVTPLSPNDGLDFSQYDCSSSNNPHTQTMSLRRQQARGGAERGAGGCTVTVSKLLALRRKVTPHLPETWQVCVSRMHSPPKIPLNSPQNFEVQISCEAIPGTYFLFLPACVDAVHVNSDSPVSPCSHEGAM